MPTERDGPPPLMAGQVHVWIARVSELAASRDALLRTLDSEERARGDRFVFEADRTRHVVSHGVLRLLLAGYLGLRADEPRFTVGPHGKPSLGGRVAPETRFNLSHSGDLALVAVAVRDEVGVDVQRWSREQDDAMRELTVRRMFSHREREQLDAVPAAARAETFFRIWARKEAYVKALGESVTQGLDQFDVSAGDEVNCLIADRRSTTAPERWTLRGVPVDAGYSAAVAVASRDPDIRVSNVTPAIVQRADDVR